MCEKGWLSGNKLAGIKFRLIDGLHHCVDSSEHAFFQAAQGAMKDVFLQGSWQILEPIMTVEISAPIEFQVNQRFTLHMNVKITEDLSNFETASSGSIHTGINRESREQTKRYYM